MWSVNIAKFDKAVAIKVGCADGREPTVALAYIGCGCNQAFMAINLQPCSKSCVGFNDDHFWRAVCIQIDQAWAEVFEHAGLWQAECDCLR